MCNDHADRPGAADKASSGLSFPLPGDKASLEDGARLTPKFDANGLITVVTTDVLSGDVLMVAHMNAEALAKTLATDDVWYWSRSRSKLWRKGETSGHTQKVREIRIDCDQDALWIKAEQTGPACHTGRRSCFYRVVEAEGTLTMLDAAIVSL